MSKLAKLTLLLCLFALLAACAPAATGSSRMNPFELGNGYLIVEPGERYFVESRRNPNLLKLSFDGLSDNKLWGASKGSRYYTTFNGLDTSVSGLPGDWLELRRARGVQTITDVDKSGRSVRVWWNESVEFLFSLDVPADAEPGLYTGFVTLSSRKGSSMVRVAVRVNPSITPSIQASR